MMERKIAAKRKTLNWGPSDDSLPSVSPQAIASGSIDRKIIDHNEWMIMDDYVIDVSSFLSKHPGGAALLEKYFGRDVTKSFDGILQTHSLAARTLVKTLRVAKVSQASVKRRDSAKSDVVEKDLIVDRVESPYSETVSKSNID